MPNKCEAVNCMFADLKEGKRIIRVEEDNVSLCIPHFEMANGKWKKGRKPNGFMIQRAGETRQYFYRRGATKIAKDPKKEPVQW